MRINKHVCITCECAGDSIRTFVNRFLNTPDNPPRLPHDRPFGAYPSYFDCGLHHVERGRTGRTGRTVRNLHIARNIDDRLLCEVQHAC